MEKYKEIFMYALAALLFLGFFSILGALIFVEIPGRNEALLNVLLGVLGTCFVMTISYFFGSSKGSADKNLMMAETNKAAIKEANK